MKQLLVFLLIAFGVTTVSSQVLTSAMGASPEEIVKRFVKLDVGGERVTPEGWQKADALFIQPSKPPTDFKIVVMASDYAVSEDPLAGKPGEVFLGYEELGEVGSSLRFELAPSRVETKIFESYVAVQIAKPPKARGIAQENSSLEWRIQGAQPQLIHMTAPGAVRYLTRMKNETKDPAMKANAKKAIANFEEIFLTEKNEEISYLCLSDWM
jgi:hypothetical protein